MVFINNKCQNIDFDEAIVYNATLTTLKAHDSADCEVSILLTDDAEIQMLNHQYRHIDRPTDVLAFAMREGTGGDLNPQLLGDLVISVSNSPGPINCARAFTRYRACYIECTRYASSSRL